MVPAPTLWRVTAFNILPPPLPFPFPGGPPLKSRGPLPGRDTVCNPEAERVTEVSLEPGRVTETSLDPVPGRERDTLCNLERDTDLRPEERDTDCSLLCI